MTLAIDPGLRCLGYVVFDENENRLVEHGAFEHGPEEGDHPRRVMLYTEDVAGVFERVHPLTLAIEDQQPPGRGAGGEAKARFWDLIAVARLVGRLWGLADGTDCEVEFVNPRAAKKALTGNGNASKDQIVNAALSQYGITERTKPRRESQADALGIALASRRRLIDDRLREAAR